MNSILTKLSLLLVVGAVGCATYGKPQFKSSTKAYDKDFDTVWSACLNAVDEEPIDRSDKSAREISTKPVTNTVINGKMSRYTTIKISENKPYTVRVRVTATRTTASMMSGGMIGNAEDAFSDEDKEKEILEKIDNALK